MSRPLQISVCGGARSDYADEQILGLAEAVGRKIAEAGAVLVCGGGPGVMEAASRGAAGAGGEVIGILRGDDACEANPHVTHVVASGIGQGRNLAVAASGDAVIAVGGEWGTLSEIAFARRLGRTVVVLEGWTVSGRGPMVDGPGIVPATDAADAVAKALAAAREAGSPSR